MMTILQAAAEHKPAPPLVEYPRMDPFKLRCARYVLGLSLTDLADRCHKHGVQMSKHNLANIECYRRNPGPAVRFALLEALQSKSRKKVPTRDLYSDADEWAANAALYRRWDDGGRGDIGAFLRGELGIDNADGQR